MLCEPRSKTGPRKTPANPEGENPSQGRAEDGPTQKSHPRDGRKNAGIPDPQESLVSEGDCEGHGAPDRNGRLSPSRQTVEVMQLALMPVRTPKRGTQHYELLMAMQAGERLTVAKALTRYGVYALSQRIGELKKMGWPISSRTIEATGGARISEYWMADGQSLT